MHGLFMKLQLAFLAWMLSVWVCTAQATNEVKLAAASSVPVANSHVSALAKEVLGTDDPGTNTVALIAWAAKYSEIGLPPEVAEDAIVLARRADTRGTNQWVLAYVSCTTYSAHGRSWSPVRIPGLSWEEEFAAQPSNEAIAAFIRSTNFGANDCRPDVRILRTICYIDAPKIIQTLADGIPDQEKLRRLQAAAAAQMPPPR